MEYSNHFSQQNNPTFDPQTGQWTYPQQQQQQWPASYGTETGNNAMPSETSAHIHHQSYGSGGYTAGNVQQTIPLGALPHTLATNALDLAVPTHLQHPSMASYDSSGANVGYGVPELPQVPRTYSQQQQQVQLQPQHLQQHQPVVPRPSSQAQAQAQAQGGHPMNYPSNLGKHHQQNLLARRFASMPQRAAVDHQQQQQQAQAQPGLYSQNPTSPQYDMNAAMNALIGNQTVPSAAYTLSPGQSPTIPDFRASPPVILSGGSASRSATGGRNGSTSTTASKTAKTPKRAKKRKVADQDDHVDEFDDEGDEGNEGNGKGPTKQACRKCKLQKIRCVPVPGESICQKCRQNNQQCVFDKRRPPRNPNKREYFLAQIREKDAIIESLLKEKYNPYNATPLSVKSFRETAQPGADTFAFLNRLEEGTVRPTLTTSFNFREPSSATGNSDGEDADRSDEEASDDVGSAGRAEKDSPLDEAYPIAMLGNLQLSERRLSTKSASSNEETAVEDQDNVGPPNKQYFVRRPQVVVDQQNKSDLLTHGLLNEAEVDTLFRIYHEKLNAFIPLLDPVLHTPEETFKRCPCLFSVICAITCRYDDDPRFKKIYPVAMHFAKNECANALMHGLKSVGLAQAFMLLAFYHNPAKRWEEERAYLYAGLATRIAIDLNLHIAPVMKTNRTEKEERDVLDKLRLWMICYQTDWNMAAHFGKPSSVRDNQIILSSDNFWKRSQFNLIGDIGLSAYNRLLRTVSGFFQKAYSAPESRTGLNKSQDFRSLCDEYDIKLREVEDTWTREFKGYTRFSKDEAYHFRCSLLPYAVNYCRLVMGCFGFQQTFEKGKQSPDRVFMTKCMAAATGVVTTFVDSLAPSGYMRYAPNGWFNFCSFACAFLIKLLRPEFSNILWENEKQDILILVRRLTETLISENVAIDERHTPMLWARFLQDLLNKKNSTSDASVVTSSHSQTPTSVTAPQTQHMQQDHYNQMQPVGPSTGMPMYTAGMPNMPIEYSQWSTAQCQPQPTPSLHGAYPQLQQMYAPAPTQGFMIGQGFYQPSLLPMVVDDDSSMAIMGAIAPDAPFWDNMMMPGHGIGWAESPQSQGAPEVITPPVQTGADMSLNMEQWFPSGR